MTPGLMGIAALRCLLHWLVRPAVSSLTLLVCLAPVLMAYKLLQQKGIDDFIMLDATPWAGWLGLAHAASMLVMWSIFCIVWQNTLKVLGLALLMMGLTLSVTAVAVSDPMWKWLNAQQVRAVVEQRSLVLAHYTTTSSGRGSRLTHHWVNISHPLSPGKALKLPDYRLPSTLISAGFLVCATVKTGRWGWRWMEALRPCPAADATQPQPGWGLTLLQAQLLEHRPWRMGNAEQEGHFDEQGRAWWFGRDQLHPTLKPAGEAEATEPSALCHFWRESRLSTDKRAVVGYMNRSAVGQVEPPPLPHWETLGRNVWVQRREDDGRCTSVGLLLHPGWVLDVDFDHASQRLAVLSAHRTNDTNTAPLDPEALVYRVTLYTFDADGKAQLGQVQVLTPEPLWNPFPLQAKLFWGAGGLVLKHPNAMWPPRVVLQGTPPVQSGLGGPVQQPSVMPPMPAVLAPLAAGTWKLSAQAPRAPILIYTHPDYDGFLLLHQARGQWFHVSPLQLPMEAPDAPAPKQPKVEPDVLAFGHLKLQLSPDGHRLMACGSRYFVGGPSRCALLSLPWPD